MAIVADADVIIDHLRKKHRFPEAARHLAAGTLVTNVIVRDEIMYGAADEEQRARLRAFLDLIPTRELSIPAADLAARIRRDLDDSGSTLGDPGRADIFIAAVTIVHEDQLLTGNRKHFERLVKHGLKLAPR